MASNKKVIWSPAAEEDFRSILDYLQNNWSQRVINILLIRLTITLVL
jgi:plasmid stabilization system protein ParE